MGKGFSGLPGGMGGMLKQVQKMQQDLQRVQGELEHYKAEGSAGGGMVKVVATGKFQIEEVVINPQVLEAKDVDMLQDLVMAAVNEAMRKVQDNTKSEMSKVTGGVQIPGLF